MTDDDVKRAVESERLNAMTEEIGARFSREQRMRALISEYADTHGRGCECDWCALVTDCRRTQMQKPLGPTSGEPFYCVTCGAGYGEYVSCEIPDCKLESRKAAKRRAKP